MEVLGVDACAPPPGGSALTIGAYDGVHRGHRHVLERLRHGATSRGLASVVVTFDRHPASVVRPESAPRLLTDLEQKLELLASCGVDRTLVVPFDRRRAGESAEDFIDEVLVGMLGARLVVVGEDFHFGHGRRGNVALLEQMGAAAGFEVDGIGLSDLDGEVVSSTRVRNLVGAGDMEGAAVLLGRLHQVRGTVVRGDGRGGPELGFPTANVAVPDDIALPGDGVYAGWYERPTGGPLRAAVSVGRRPTFYEGAEHSLVEAYLLDTDPDLYGERARVSFAVHLRGQQRFDTVGQLAEAMKRDVARTSEVLGEPPAA